MAIRAPPRAGPSSEPACTTGADHGNAVEVTARNLATGKRNTIILVTRPDPRANNWPPGVSGLTWAPDDVHLAVQFQLTAAVGSVLVLGAFSHVIQRISRGGATRASLAAWRPGRNPSPTT